VWSTPLPVFRAPAVGFALVEVSPRPTPHRGSAYSVAAGQPRVTFDLGRSVSSAAVTNASATGTRALLAAVDVRPGRIHASRAAP